ncbi:MAG: hypothetical protein QOF16_253, partial [Actinomycetota bacterium]|nr:hypothetical protein [Actinomycetota bacterium]
ALIGGAVGIGATGRAAAGSTRAAPSPETIILKGRGFRLHSDTFERGQLPAAGDRLIISGDLLGGISGRKKVGDFHGTYTALKSPGSVGQKSVVSMQHHTFVLAEGTLLGSGTATYDPDMEDDFALIGGTGRYAGATGTYTAIQRYVDLGGTGTAEFTMTITPREARHGAR